MEKTYIPKSKEIKRKWYLIDAKGRILGRIATQAARILRGKHKSMFTPHLDCGDYVVVINAKEVRVTGRKMDEKLYKRYSGYPSGLKQTALKEMLRSKPEQVLKQAIKGMLPKGPLGRDIFQKLKVYPGGEHHHQAQAPKVLEVN